MKLFYSFILAALLAACSSSKTTQLTLEDIPKGSILKSDELYMHALTSKTLENYQEALDTLRKVVLLNPFNDAAYYEMSRIVMEQKDFNQAEHFIKNALSIDDSNQWYLLLYFELLGKRNDMEESLRVIDELIRVKPNTIAYYEEKTNLLILAKKYREAIESIEVMELVFSEDFQSVRRKEELYRALKKPEEAIQTIENFVAKDSTNVRRLLLLAQTYQHTKELVKAITILQKVANLDPTNGTVLMTLADYYASQGDKQKHRQYQEKAFRSKTISFDNKMKVLFKYVQFIGKDSVITKEVLDLGKILTEVHSQEPTAYAVLGELHYQAKNNTKAIEYYEQSLSISKNQFNVWNQLLAVHTEMQNYDKVISVGNSAKELFPNQNFIYYLQGIAYNQTKDYKKAIPVLEKGLELTFDDGTAQSKSMTAEINSQLGEAYNYTNDFEKSDKHFMQSIAIDSNNVYILNNYSYYLSLRKEKLERAERLSKRSNTLKPNSTSFEDTYAWILFQLNKFEEANIWIDKAMLHGGANNGTIVEHKGDILYKLGSKTEAIEHWKKAKSFGGTSDLIDKKIQDGKWYE